MNGLKKFKRWDLLSVVVWTIAIVLALVLGYHFYEKYWVKRPTIATGGKEIYA